MLSQSVKLCGPWSQVSSHYNTYKTNGRRLTEYMLEAQIKVRYFASDIDTLERIEIIRDLRLRRGDVLIGINLLRKD